MPTWSKVVLALGTVVVLAVLGYLGARRWWLDNRLRIGEMASQARVEGYAFGQKADAEGCIREALARQDAVSGLFERAVQKTFLKACLAAARRPPGFCDTVPRPGEVMKTALWSNAECERRKHGNNQSCATMMQALADACWPEK